MPIRMRSRVVQCKTGNDGEQTILNLLFFIYLKQTFLHLVQIAFCQQSVLELILSVAETNIYNKTNITLSSGLYENMKKAKHQFANVQFICTIAALKAHNNHISNHSLSETAQNLARSFESYFFGTTGNSCVWSYDKKYKTSVYSLIRVTSKSVGKQVCNVYRTVSVYRS